MKRSENSQQAVKNLSREGAVRIGSAEGRGVGTTVRGAEDAKALTREAGQRALRISGAA